MNTKFKLITTILMFLLIFALLFVVFKYYSKPVEVKNELPIAQESFTSQEVNKLISNSASGEVVSSNINNSVSVETENTDVLEVQETLISEEHVSKPKKEDDKTVIMTSEDSMTNKEKREILTDLDNTLMELLDVVNKVQTVDESRLITDESEVQN